MTIRNKSYTVDHSITLIIILFVIFLFSSIQFFAQEKAENKSSKKEKILKIPNSTQSSNNTIDFKNSGGNSILTITDEGNNAGSITIPETSPKISTNKLYNEGGTLKFNGSSLGSGSINEINDLSDAKYFGTSLFLGEGAGDIDDGSNNYNTAVGINALQSNSIGSNNVAFGNGALQLNTANRNTALGSASLYNNLTGSYNIANGYGALYNNTIGSYNIGIGNSTNFYNQKGSNNTIIGYEAGKGTANHNKSGNIFIGYQAGFNELNDNRLYIENSNSSTPLIWGDFANDLAAVNGKLGVGIQSPSDRVHISAASGENALRVQVDGGTKFRVFSNGGAAIGTNNSSGTPANGLYVHGNAGFGVSNPTEKIEVNGKIKSSQLQLTAGANSGFVLTSDASGNASWQAGSNDDNDWTLSGNNLYSTPIGNVGIGVTNPTSKLQVNGSIRGTVIRLTTGAQNGYVLTSDANGNASWQASSSSHWSLNGNDIWTPYNVGIGIGTPETEFEVIGKIKSSQIKLTDGASDGYVLTSDANGNASWQAGSSGDEDWIIDGSDIYHISGNVGIGSGSPNSKLTVGGSGNSSAVISGENYTSDGYGVYGKTWASGYSVGVYGTVGGAGGNTESIGVYGYNTSGVGVQGSATNGGIGVLGTRGSATFGLAGRFEGPVEVTGKLSVGANPTPMAYQLAVDGTAAKSSGGTSWAVASDIRLKNVLGNYEKGLNEILDLKTIMFKYQKGNPLNLPTENTEYGFIAQEVQKIFPEAVSEMKDGFLDFNFHPIHVAMVNAVKTLNQKNIELENRINELENKNQNLLNVNSEYSAMNENLLDRIKKIEEKLSTRRFVSSRKYLH